MLEFPKFYNLKDDLPVFVRLFRPSDINQIIVGFNKMSERSRYRRFFQPIRKLPESHLNNLMNVDSHNNLAICAGVIQPNAWEGVGIVRFHRNESDLKTADVSLTVIDKYQGKGLGKLLFQLIGQAALECGITDFTGQVMPDNWSMIKILNHYPAQSHVIGGPVIDFRIPLQYKPIEIKTYSYQFEDFVETHL